MSVTYAHEPFSSFVEELQALLPEHYEELCVVKEYPLDPDWATYARLEQAGQNAQAAQSGAFGGSRQGVLQAEGQRNLNQQLNDIQAQGSNAAFQNAQNQYNTGLGQELQMGGMQQSQNQQGLNTAYNDFLAQKNYPYQQLSYMSNLIRGTPMGMNQTSQVYQAPPNPLSQMAGLGTAGYAVSQMKTGGSVTAQYPSGLGALALSKM